MKFLLLTSLTLILTTASAQEYIKTIQNSIDQNPKDFFADKKTERYIEVKTDPKTKKTNATIAKGGSYPAATFKKTISKPLAFITRHLDGNKPQTVYEEDIVQINFQDLQGKPQSTVCEVTNFPLCGRARLHDCVPMTDGKQDLKHGLYAAPAHDLFVYNSGLNETCNQNDEHINQNRKKLQELIREKEAAEASKNRSK